MHHRIHNLKNISKTHNIDRALINRFRFNFNGTLNTHTYAISVPIKDLIQQHPSYGIVYDIPKVGAQFGPRTVP